jgi:hypothetical protein
MSGHFFQRPWAVLTRRRTHGADGARFDDLPGARTASRMGCARVRFVPESREGYFDRLDGNRKPLRRQAGAITAARVVPRRLRGIAIWLSARSGQFAAVVPALSAGYGPRCLSPTKVARARREERPCDSQEPSPIRWPSVARSRSSRRCQLSRLGQSFDCHHPGGRLPGDHWAVADRWQNEQTITSRRRRHLNHTLVREYYPHLHALGQLRARAISGEGECASSKSARPLARGVSLTLKAASWTTAAPLPIP